MDAVVAVAGEEDHRRIGLRRVEQVVGREGADEVPVVAGWVTVLGHP